MGANNCCCRRGEENQELYLQNPDSIIPLKQIYFTNGDNMITTSNQELDISNSNKLIKSSDDLLKMYYLKDNAAKKIQRNFRSYNKQYKCPQGNLRSSKVRIIKNSNEDLQNLYSYLEKKGSIPSEDDFTLDGWKRFYPLNDSFFNFDKGQVLAKQVIINNKNDLENLEIYEGDVNTNNLMHGIGKMRTTKYGRIGTWREGQFTGWNRESQVNGDILEGKFINGKVNGKGIFKNAKRTYYVGDFVDNVPQGEGEMKTNKFIYNGHFEEGNFHGKGKIKFFEDGHEYEGDFEKGEITGLGRCKWTNGDIYEGQMEKGKMNGNGRYTYTNGQIYEGGYVNGLKQGLGKIIYPNDKQFEGIFVHGNPSSGTLINKGRSSAIRFNRGKSYLIEQPKKES